MRLRALKLGTGGIRRLGASQSIADPFDEVLRLPRLPARCELTVLFRVELEPDDPIVGFSVGVYDEMNVPVASSMPVGGLLDDATAPREFAEFGVVMAMPVERAGRFRLELVATAEGQSSPEFAHQIDFRIEAAKSGSG